MFQFPYSIKNFITFIKIYSLYYFIIINKFINYIVSSSLNKKVKKIYKNYNNFFIFFLILYFFFTLLNINNTIIYIYNMFF